MHNVQFTSKTHSLVARVKHMSFPILTCVRREVIHDKNHSQVNFPTSSLNCTTRKRSSEKKASLAEKEECRRTRMELFRLFDGKGSGA